MATQTFDTAAGYVAATGPQLWLIDFNGSTGTSVAGNSFGADVTFSSPESATPAMVVWSSDALTDAGSTTAPNNVGPIGGVFTSTVNAFAFEYVSGGLGSVTLYDAGGSEIAELTPLSNSGFFGVVSDTPIKSFVIVGREFTEAEVPGGGIDRIFIDNFRVNQLLSIEALCPCAGPWTNHGAYMSCVTTAARQLRDAGVISSIGPTVSRRREIGLRQVSRRHEGAARRAAPSRSSILRPARSPARFPSAAIRVTLSSILPEASSPAIPVDSFAKWT